MFKELFTESKEDKLSKKELIKMINDAQHKLKTMDPVKDRGDYKALELDIERWKYLTLRAK